MGALRNALAGLTRPSRIRGMAGERVPDPIAQQLLASSRLDELDERLGAFGVTTFSPLGFGASSVVFDAGGGRAVRLGLGDLVEVHDIACVIRPLASGQVGGLRFEIVPRAQTTRITQADVEAVSQRLLEQGWRFSDAGVDNVGRVDGHLVVLDPGAVAAIPISNEPVAAPMRAGDASQSAAGAEFMNPRIFVSVYPTGIVWADRQRHEHSDYARLGFMPFSTLALELDKLCPPDLRVDIEAHAAEFAGKRGQQYQVSTSGQTVTLGHADLAEANRQRQRG